MDTRYPPATPSEAKDVIDILVIDVDSTAIFANTLLANGNIEPNPRRDSLSQTLIDHVKKASYQGFYLCTHRCLKYTYEATLSARLQRIYSEGPSAVFQPENPFMVSVIRHFTEATGLPFIAASTYDDNYLETLPGINPCGYAYEKHIKPYEEKLLAANKSSMKKRKIPDYHDINYRVTEKHFTGDEIPSTKNKQYLSIARHAEKQFPDKKIHLHAADDVFDICSAALSIAAESLQRVKLSVYYHHPHKQIAMQYVGCVFGPAYFKNAPPATTSTSRIQAQLQRRPEKMAEEKTPDTDPDAGVIMLTIHEDPLVDEEATRNRELKYKN